VTLNYRVAFWLSSWRVAHLARAVIPALPHHVTRLVRWVAERDDVDQLPPETAMGFRFRLRSLSYGGQGALPGLPCRLTRATLRTVWNRPLGLAWYSHFYFAVRIFPWRSNGRSH